MEGIAIDSLYIIMGIKRTMFSIMPSRHRRDIRKWDCWRRRAKMARVTEM